MKLIKKWQLFKQLYRQVVNDNGLRMTMVPGSEEAKTYTAERFQTHFTVVERLALGPDYYLCRDAEGEYRIFSKVPGEPQLYREIDEIVIE